jgi:hypothetical protein
MRWPWNRKGGHPEPAPVTPERLEVWDLEKMKHQFEGRGFTVYMADVNSANIGHWAVQPIMADPLDIEPAFHMRYEPVKFGQTISLSAIKKNVRTFKLRVREVYTDPKRVARRYWHRYMVKKRFDQIVDDSNLFYGNRRPSTTTPALVSRLARKGNIRLVQ